MYKNNFTRNWVALWGDLHTFLIDIVIPFLTQVTFISRYAGCNVLQEHLLGDVDPAELLSMLGIFGLVLSLCQGLPLELPTALHAPWHLSAIGPWIGYGLAMFSFYSLVPYELEWGGAAILNLSLLSSDLWTAMARLVFFGGFSEWSALSFTIAFLFVAAGIAFYSHTGEVKRSGDVDGSEMVPPGPRGHRYKSLITGISHDDDDDYVIANNTNNRSNNNSIIEGITGNVMDQEVGGSGRDMSAIRKDRRGLRLGLGLPEEDVAVELVTTPPGARRHRLEEGREELGEAASVVPRSGVSGLLGGSRNRHLLSDEEYR